jgi:DNA-binding LacI/PurR family transcriptional regulator
VINGHPAVSERTRKKVLQVIQEQNFRPNLAARALVTHQTRTLSLVIPQAIAYTFTDPYFPTLIQGVTAKANEFDYAVMLWVGSGDEEQPTAAPSYKYINVARLRPLTSCPKNDRKSSQSKPSLS